MADLFPKPDGTGGKFAGFVEVAKRMRRSRPRQPEPPAVDLLPHARRWYRAADRQPLADELGVDVQALDQLRVGRATADDLAGLGNAPRPAWTWPMRDGANNVIGVRLRYDDGSKRAVIGSRQGLFYVADVQPVDELLYVVEGCSDAAAMFTLGFNNVIGLPSAGQGADLLALLTQRLSPPTPRCILIADRDEPGIAGMERVARQLARWGVACRVTEPPGTAGDVRGYLNAGGDAAGILMLAEGEAEREVAV
ncbi:MAG: toprim domain-containing protein [Planctomycetota bacterium]